MIHITNGERTAELTWDGVRVSVSRLLEQAGLHPDRPCGGQGRCGKWPTARCPPPRRRSEGT